MKVKTIGPTKTSRSGAAVVEAALMLPLMVIFTFGSVDIAQYINRAQVVSNSSREAARVASRSDTTNTSEIREVVLDYFRDAFPRLGKEELEESVNIWIKKTGESNYQTINGDLGSIESGDPILVEVEFDYECIRWLTGPTYKSLETKTYCRRE